MGFTGVKKSPYFFKGWSSKTFYLDLFSWLFFYGFYHDKSPSSRPFGEYVFSNHRRFANLSKSLRKWSTWLLKLPIPSTSWQCLWQYQLPLDPKTYGKIDGFKLSKYGWFLTPITWRLWVPMVEDNAKFCTNPKTSKRLLEGMDEPWWTKIHLPGRWGMKSPLDHPWFSVFQVDLGKT